MKNLAYALFALVSSTVFAPTLAKAQNVRVRIGDDRVVSRDYHREYTVRATSIGTIADGSRDRVVVVKQRPHHWN